MALELSGYLRQHAATVDAALDRWLPGADLLPPRLHQAMRYSVFAGGKRLRPILIIAACEAVGGAAERVLGGEARLILDTGYPAWKVEWSPDGESGLRCAVNCMHKTTAFSLSR